MKSVRPRMQGSCTTRSPQKRLLVIPNAEHDTTYQTAPQLYESTVKRFLKDALQRPAPPGE